MTTRTDEIDDLQTNKHKNVINFKDRILYFLVFIDNISHTKMVTQFPNKLDTLI